MKYLLAIQDINTEKTEIFEFANKDDRADVITKMPDHFRYMETDVEDDAVPPEPLETIE